MAKNNKGPKRTKDQRLKDHQTIADLYLLGKKQYEIGKHLGLTQQQISSDLKLIRASWLESSIIDFDAKKAEELAKLDRTEEQAWAAWERSQKEAKKQSNKVTATHDGKKGGIVPGSSKLIETNTHKESRVGDPRFLDVVLRTIERRCKIFGFDAPIKTEEKGTLAHSLRAIFVDGETELEIEKDG